MKFARPASSNQIIQAQQPIPGIVWIFQSFENIRLKIIHVLTTTTEPFWTLGRNHKADIIQAITTQRLLDSNGPNWLAGRGISWHDIAGCQYCNMKIAMGVPCRHAWSDIGYCSTWLWIVAVALVSFDGFVLSWRTILQYFRPIPIYFRSCRPIVWRRSVSITLAMKQSTLHQTPGMVATIQQLAPKHANLDSLSIGWQFGFDTHLRTVWQ